MTVSQRALYGATFGALLTLVVHPVSRPYVLSLFTPRSRFTNALAASTSFTVSSPALLESAKLQSLSEKVLARSPISRASLENEISEVRLQQRKDRGNAFWLQSLAALEHLVGRNRMAFQYWIAAASADAWNDYQSDLLLSQSDHLDRLLGAHQSWHLAYLYRQRSLATVELIASYSRFLLSGADFVSPESLTARYSVVLNGNLLRNGARNVQLGIIGSDLVKLGAYPDAVEKSPKRLVLGQNEVFNGLVNIGKSQWATDTQSAFREDEAWLALVQEQRPDEKARELALNSAIFASLPSATLVTGLLGAALLSVGLLLAKMSGKFRDFGTATPIAIGVALAAMVYLLTSFALASFAAGLCGLFLFVKPRQQRSRATADFGPLFLTLVSLIGLADAALIGAYLGGFGAPASIILPMLDVPNELFDGSSLFAGLATLGFATLFLLSPLWAIAQRVPSPLVLATAIRYFGTTLMVIGIGGSVVLGPISVYCDLQNSDSLTRILKNEPIYYLKYAQRT